MRYSLFIVAVLIITFSGKAQSLVDYNIGNGSKTNLNFLKVDSFFYQVGVIDEEITVGFNNKTQVVSEANNFKDQIYVVKYDLDYNIIWSSVFQYTRDVSRIQTKYSNGYLYVLSAERGAGILVHKINRINVNDPDDIGFMAKFETSYFFGDYTFEISDKGDIAIAGTYAEKVKFYFSGQADKEFTCNSDQNIFLVRYQFQGNGFFSYAHIVQREWGNPGSNKRYFGAIAFDVNDNLHLFGSGNGSVQLDGNSGESIGKGTAFQVSYSPSNDLLKFEESDLFSFDPAIIIDIGNDRNAIIGGADLGILDENMEIISIHDIPFNSSSKVIDVVLDESTYTALFEYKPSIYSIKIDDYTFQSPTNDFAIMNLDFEGNLNWYSFFGGDSFTDVPISLDYLENGDLLLSGITNDTLDIDPSRNVVKIPYQRNTFFVCEYSTECKGLNAGLKNIDHITCDQNALLEFGVNGGTKPYQFYFDNNLVSDIDAIEIEEPGLYSASVLDAVNCSKEIYVPVKGPKTDPNEKLNLHQHAGDFRSGFDANIYYSLSNSNCIPRSGKIKIVLDDLIQYVGASITPTIVENQNLEFDYTDLIYEDIIFKLNLDVRISDDALFGSDLCARIYIYDDQGNEIENSIICKEVINSYDPNDISVSPYGRCIENYFLENEILEYTIRFQNLGNAEAINIEIADTLSTNLDVSTFVETNSSHDALVHIEEDSILVINYKNILLPSESQDKDGSNGYFSYKIKALPNQKTDTKIDNRAAIYFDFNDPVITNTVRSTLTEDLPQCVLTNTIDEERNALSFYPNPVIDNLVIEFQKSSNNNIRVYDMSGNRFYLDMKNENNLSVLDVSLLNSGLYLVKVNEQYFRFYKE